MQQRSEEWFAERLGKVTASRIGDVMAKTKSGYSASRKNYMAQLIVERMTGQPTDSYTNAAMQWGTETEPYAREAYEILTGELVEEVGFMAHPCYEMAGASPDGLVGDDGLIEIKCPQTSTHIEFLLNPKIDRKYQLQMQFQMVCAARSWCDFVSYDPRIGEELRFSCKRVERDPSLCEEIESEVQGFLAELDTTIERLESLRTA